MGALSIAFLGIPITIVLLTLARTHFARVVLSTSLVLTILSQLLGNLFAYVQRDLGRGLALHEAVQGWLQDYVFRKVLIGFVPGFEVFSSTDFIKRGWIVPWPFMGEALSYALVYMVICFGLGYVLFRSREFE